MSVSCWSKQNCKVPFGVKYRGAAPNLAGEYVEDFSVSYIATRRQKSVISILDRQ